MAEPFRALRLTIILARVVGWVMFILGVTLAILVATLGFLQSAAGTPSLMLGNWQVPAYLANPVTGLILGIAILIGAILQFIAAFAFSEWITLFLTIERNTRETVYYLRGEGELAFSAEPALGEGQDLA